MCGACSELWKKGPQEILAVLLLLAKVLNMGEGTQGSLATASSQ